MKKLILTIALISVFRVIAFTQDLNCECYKADSLMYLACQKYMQQCYENNNPAVYFQGSKASQVGMDSIIAICPYFAHAYYTKAIPYLKRGEFVLWKKLIDKAVEYSPLDYLGYRAGARFMFLRDYKGALNDIEILDSLISYDIGYIYNGDYHLKEVQALCYKFLSKNKQAILKLESHLANESNTVFGYFHLGVLYLENGELHKAIQALKKQLEIFPFAETHYYLALVYKNMSNTSLYLNHIDISLQQYKSGNTMARDFMYYPDKIYLSDIEREYFK